MEKREAWKKVANDIQEKISREYGRSIMEEYCVANYPVIERGLFHYNGIPLIQIAANIYAEFRYKHDASERIIHEILNDCR